MKKIVLALAGAASLLSSTPVLAQWQQSANPGIYYQSLGDPAYQANRRIAREEARRNNYGYGSYPAYDTPVVAGGDSTCVLGIVCITRGPRPHPGERCYDAKGQLYYLGKDLVARVAEGSGGAQDKIAEVDVTCSNSTYHATAAPVTQVVPVAATTAQPNVFSYWDGNYYITVTKFPDGTQKITREYRQR